MYSAAALAADTNFGVSKLMPGTLFFYFSPVRPAMFINVDACASVSQLWRYDFPPVLFSNDDMQNPNLKFMHFETPRIRCGDLK